MNMRQCLLIISFIAFVVSSSPVYASSHGGAETDKPGAVEVIVTTLEATVVSVDYENRKVTLKSPGGKTVTIDVGEQVKNLPQVDPGDLITVDYVEAVTIQVLAKDEIEPGVTTVEVVKSAKPGQKPSGVVMEEITVVATIEAIDKDQQLVTLKGVEGKSKTVKAYNPENLEKVKVGDKVEISYITALAISVTE